jgi:uncharacterized protein YecE (DUF72 family)
MDAYVYFSNDVRPQAPKDARELVDLLAGRRADGLGDRAA